LLKKHNVYLLRFLPCDVLRKSNNMNGKIWTTKSTWSKGKQQATNKSTLSVDFQWAVHNTSWYHAASSIKSTQH
jgi:hypothetical protein